MIVNIDATLIMQKPKIAPYIDEMRSRIAQTLNIGIDAVSIKATTTEGMGFEGTGEGASAMAIATIVG
jgi:2-C-methyl-D-erythritol 2,4-cyclodiphosphate synthase